MLLSVNKVGDVISGVIGSKRYSVPFDSKVFADLQDYEELFEKAETVEEAEEIIAEALTLTQRNVQKELEVKATDLHFNEETQRFYLIEDDKISSVPIPTKLADLMLKMYEEGTTVQPLVRAWTLFLDNDNFTPEKAELFAEFITTTALDEEEYQEYIAKGYSETKATELATYSDVSITKNGLLVTNKYVSLVDEYDREYSAEYEKNQNRKEDAKAEDAYLLPPLMKTTGDPLLVNGESTHLVKIGKVHSLPNWSYVNCNDNTFAAKGAHLGGLRYIKSYEGKTSILLDCLVSPNKIGAFDRSGNGAIRVLEYYVMGANFAKNKSLYHESNYAYKIEEEWANTRAEAIAKSEAVVNALKEMQNKISALIEQAQTGELTIDQIKSNVGQIIADTVVKEDSVNTEVELDDPDDIEDDDDEVEYNECDNCGNECGDWQSICDDCEQEEERLDQEEEDRLVEEEEAKRLAIEAEESLQTKLEAMNMADYTHTIYKYTKLEDDTVIQPLVEKFIKELGLEKEYDFESFCDYQENEDNLDEGVFISVLELEDLLIDFYEWVLAV